MWTKKKKNHTRYVDLNINVCLYDKLYLIYQLWYAFCFQMKIIYIWMDNDNQANFIIKQIEYNKGKGISFKKHNVTVIIIDAL